MQAQLNVEGERDGGKQWGGYSLDVEAMPEQDDAPLLLLLLPPPPPPPMQVAEGAGERGRFWAEVCR